MVTFKVICIALIRGRSLGRLRLLVQGKVRRNPNRRAGTERQEELVPGLEHDSK